MRCLSQDGEHCGLFSQARKEMDEDTKKEKEISQKGKCEIGQHFNE